MPEAKQLTPHQSQGLKFALLRKSRLGKEHVPLPLSAVPSLTWKHPPTQTQEKWKSACVCKTFINE